jgi:hypothetical protein
VLSGERYVVVSLADMEMGYLSGHVMDGRILFPAMGYIVSCALSLNYVYSNLTP